MTGIKRCIALACMAVCCIVLLAACGGGAENTSAGTASGSDDALTFVAADKTNWDKAVSIGDYAYNIAAVLNDDGTVTMTATCAGEGASGEPEEGVDYSANSFIKTGTWIKEEGYGYTVTIDGYTAKTDYDKASARQYIYMEIENGGETSGLVQLQAKDVAFRDEMADDYEDFEIRDAQYIFTASGTSGNGNATQTKVYLEKDGSANAIVQQGSSPTYTRGAWTENADKTLTVTLGSELSADYCDEPGREGYRLTYNGSTMYASVSGAEIAYADSDFDGETVRTLSCPERDYTVELTEKGVVSVFDSSGSKAASGRWTEEDGVLTITLGGNTFVSDDEGSITLQFTVTSGMGPFASSEPAERAFPADGSVPEAAASDEAASDEAPASAESEG